MEKIIKPKWGWYQVLSKKRKKNHKVKYLYIEPNKSLSNQRHFKRSEHWFVLEGELYLDLVINDIAMSVTLEKGDALDIPVGSWHHPKNLTDKPCLILEIQHGEECIEEDIERKKV
jgi:mannose-6-phosphate isomerase